MANMSKQHIIAYINMMLVCILLVILCAGCHFSSTGTMVYDYQKETIVNFQPSPPLPGRLREVIIHASPKHSCFFTMQSVEEDGNRCTLIRKKDYTGLELASYRVMCSVFPESRSFAFSPECDRLFITGAHPIDVNKKDHNTITLNDMQGFSCWCDLPENSHNIEILPRKLPSTFGLNMYLQSSMFHRQHAFLSKDILLCVLHKGSIFSSILPILNYTNDSFPVFLSKIDLTTNKYQVIKQLKQDDGTDFTVIPDGKIGIKVNDDGKAAILVDHQLYVYDDKEKKLSEGIHIVELPHADSIMENNFSWISSEEICVWKFYDDENKGDYVIYNIKTGEKQIGRINDLIRDFYTPSICSTLDAVINLSTKEQKKYPSKLGSRIYEVFWLRDGLLGFTCDF